MDIVKVYTGKPSLTLIINEVLIVKELVSVIPEVIHTTTEIKAIKKLVAAHDILDLNLQIEKMFNEYNEAPPWDVPSLMDLKNIKHELVIFHSKDFTPQEDFQKYCSKLGNFFRLISMRGEQFSKFYC